VDADPADVVVDASKALRLYALQAEENSAFLAADNQAHPVGGRPQFSNQRTAVATAAANSLSNPATQPVRRSARTGIGASRPKRSLKPNLMLGIVLVFEQMVVLDLGCSMTMLLDQMIARLKPSCVRSNTCLSSVRARTETKLCRNN
jgi:hypothetical protein